MNNFDQCVKKNNNPIINFFHPLFDTSNLTPDEWRTNGLLDPKNLFFTYYGISSFSYTIIGFLIAFVFPNTFYIDPVIEISPVFEGICIMLQTPFTLMADVLSMYKEKSYFHPIDRIVATFNTGLIASNIIFVKWGEKILYLLVPPIGSLILIESRKARDGNNYNLCNKVLTEEYFRPNDLLNEPLFTDNQLRSVSTRVDLRNSYCNLGSRAHDKHTHIVKN